jgi:hypothetical protein
VNRCIWIFSDWDAIQSPDSRWLAELLRQIPTFESQIVVGSPLCVQIFSLKPGLDFNHRWLGNTTRTPITPPISIRLTWYKNRSMMQWYSN